MGNPFGAIAGAAVAADSGLKVEVWKDPFDVLLIAKDGTATIYQSY